MDSAHYLTQKKFNVPHAFFGRNGGVSTGVYESLNCGIDTEDTIENVQENRRRAAQLFKLSGENLFTLKQIHSPNVITLDKNSPQIRREGDAMVTNSPGIVLGVLSADCCPILFFDPEAKVIGAAHAGWKGAFSGIAFETIRAMENLGAKTSAIHVVTGPAIGAKSYEIDQGFYDKFIAQAPHNAQFFTKGKPDHHYFNLRHYIDAQLQTLPLASVQHIDRDTCAEPDMFFSYRRTCLQQEKRYGCQLSAITLT